MPDLDSLDSRMVTTLQWADDFRNLDQWDIVPKLLESKNLRTLVLNLQGLHAWAPQT
jgi:hypothetical protein